MIAEKYLYKLTEGETFHIVDQDGTPNKLDPGLPQDLLLKMYRLMVQARSFDEKALKLQRSGRMGTYPPMSGQEAVQIGSALALAQSDWMVPSYREDGAMMAFGVPMKLSYMLWMGNDFGNRIPENIKCLPISIPVGSQILHAAGIGWAANIKKEKIAILCYFGDGATSRGDFHEGLNFASVFNSPAVFLCSNNQFAISTPVAMQMHSKTIAQKAVAYGIRGYRLDGMDVLATYTLVKDALDRARNGEGPTLIEGLCYRYGPHTTADDPTLYRSKEEVEQTRLKNDPIIRFKNYLVKKGFWDDAKDRAQQEEIDSLVDKAAKEAEQEPAPKFEDLFANVFGTIPDYLREEIDYFKKVSGGR
jgi:pyruvate dehydrogenase E1 component alpha subunit